MALFRFEFTKSWRNPDQFPTYQSNEAQVRDDMQSLYDEIAHWLNETLIPGVNRIDSKVDVVKLEIRGSDLIMTDSNGQETNIGQVVPDPPAALHAVGNVTYNSDTAEWKFTFLDGQSPLTIKSFKVTKLSELSQDSEHRLVTDAEKSAWNAKGSDKMPVKGGVFSGNVSAGQYTQDPGTALFRNSSLAFSGEQPEYNGEIVWICG